MSRFINAVVIGIVAFLVVVAGLWYIIEVGQDRRLKAEAESRWVGAEGNRTTIATQLTVSNPHSYSVEIERVRYELVVSGQRLDWGELGRSDLPSPRVPADGSAAMDFEVLFPNEILFDWFRLHAREGKTESVIQGEVELLAQRENRTIRFESDRSWTTDLIDLMEGSVENCPQDPAPCVDGSDHQWIVDDERLGVRSALTVENPRDEDVVIEDIRARLLFGGTAVAQGASSGELVIEGDDDAELELLLWFDGAALMQWWPWHVSECEESPARLEVTFTSRVEEEAEPTETPSPSPAPNTTTLTTTVTPTPTNTTQTTTTSPSPSPSPSPTVPTNTSTAPSPSPGPGNGSGNGTGDRPGLVARPWSLLASHVDGVVHWLLGALGLDGSPEQEQEQPREGSEPQDVSWSFDLGTYRTAFVCKPPDSGGGIF